MDEIEKMIEEFILEMERVKHPSYPEHPVFYKGDFNLACQLRYTRAGLYDSILCVDLDSNKVIVFENSMHVKHQIMEMFGKYICSLRTDKLN